MKLLFAISPHKLNEIEQSYSLLRIESDREQIEREIECTRVNLQWKRGQLKMPNVPIEKLCLELKFVHFKLLELNLITGLILELLFQLVTQL